MFFFNLCLCSTLAKKTQLWCDSLVVQSIRLPEKAQINNVVCHDVSVHTATASQNMFTTLYG